MSAINRMLEDVMKSLIPEEIIELMTPENIQNATNKVQEYLEAQATFQRDVLERLERIENGNRDDTDKRRNASRGKRLGSGNGNGGSGNRDSIAGD